MVHSNLGSNELFSNYSRSLTGRMTEEKKVAHDIRRRKASPDQNCDCQQILRSASQNIGGANVKLCKIQFFGTLN